MLIWKQKNIMNSSVYHYMRHICKELLFYIRCIADMWLQVVQLCVFFSKNVGTALGLDLINCVTITYINIIDLLKIMSCPVLYYQISVYEANERGLQYIYCKQN